MLWSTSIADDGAESWNRWRLPDLSRYGVWFEPGGTLYDGGFGDSKSSVYLGTLKEYVAAVGKRIVLGEFGVLYPEWFYLKCLFGELGVRVIYEFRVAASYFEYRGVDVIWTRVWWRDEGFLRFDNCGWVVKYSDEDPCRRELPWLDGVLDALKWTAMSSFEEEHALLVEGS